MLVFRKILRTCYMNDPSKSKPPSRISLKLNLEILESMPRKSSNSKKTAKKEKKNDSEIAVFGV